MSVQRVEGLSPSISPHPHFLHYLLPLILGQAQSRCRLLGALTGRVYGWRGERAISRAGRETGGEGSTTDGGDEEKTASEIQRMCRVPKVRGDLQPQTQETQRRGGPEQSEGPQNSRLCQKAVSSAGGLCSSAVSALPSATEISAFGVDWKRLSRRGRS